MVRSIKEIIPIKYENINDGWQIFEFKHKGKWGAFDREGKPMIDPIYDFSFYFISDKAKVTLNGRTFFINKSGKEVPGP